MKKITPLFAIVLVITILINWTSAQDIDTGTYSQDIPNTGIRYFTDEDSNVRMWINIWGHVNRPGNYLVYSTTDVITVLAMAGGLKSGAAIDRIKLFREVPDKFGNQTYIINMDDFIETGERKYFPVVLPNDAFYVPQKVSSYILSNVGLLNTVMATINLYYLALIRQDQVR